MSDANALYGALGVLGGAVIAGAAAVYGPLRLHRRQAWQQQSGERHRSRREDRERLLRMRTSGRMWIDALERMVQDLQARRPVDIDRFDEVMAQVSREAIEAGHALAYNGLWLQADDTLPRAPVIPEVPWDTSLNGIPEAPGKLLGQLREATRSVRADVLRPTGTEPPVRSETLEALDRARAARAHMNSVLRAEIKQLNQGPGNGR